MTERSGLGLSAISKTASSASRSDRWRQAGLLLIALLVVGTVFYYLTRAVQTSTARATGDDSPLHTDP
jgi:hypothetical protein